MQKKVKKIKIIPAILEKNFSSIEKKIILLKEKSIKDVQIDVCDGKFVISKTFAFSGSLENFKRLSKITKDLNTELDMMVLMKDGLKGKPQDFLRGILLLKPKRVVFHLSSASDFTFIFNFLKKEKIKIGLAISFTDDLKKVKKILNESRFKFVQFMGIKKIGFQNQKFDNRVLDRIKNLRKEFPDLEMQVDGGVNLENSSSLKKAGADRLISGSTIFKSDDIIETINKFKNGN